MSPNPPPPPQVSPDGKFYWDGQRWVPMPAQAAAQPLPVAPSRERYPPSHWLIGGLGIVGVIVFASFCADLGGRSTSSSLPAAATSAGSTPVTTKSAGCSPQPCASAYSLTVRISGLNPTAPAGFFKPEAGNHFVLMRMTMRNDGGQDTKHISPTDFKLRDAAGVSHDITLSDTPGCDFWSPVDLAPGATYRPKPLCFQASGDSNGNLTLLWSPDIFSPTAQIPLQ